MKIRYKVGFIGVGNLAQAMIKGLIEAKVLDPKNIFGANRSTGKLQKAVETWGIQTYSTNEELVESVDIVILAVKPQDIPAAIDPIVSSFHDDQIVISLAAGITMKMLEKKLPQCRLVRAMPNTASVINRGVIGYLLNEDDPALDTVMEDLFSPLGYTLKVDDEDQFEALMVSCSSGTGFVLEFMMYFQDWIEERGFEPSTARKMVIETFLGASLLASKSQDQSLEDLQNKITSKKGVTSAGLQSMRELEIERLLRYSLEKSALRNQELAKQS